MTFQRKAGALHESVNLLTTSKPDSALTAAMAKMQLNNCRSIALAQVNSETSTDNTVDHLLFVLQGS